VGGGGWARLRRGRGGGGGGGAHLVSHVNSAEVALPLRRVRTDLRSRLNGKIMHFEFSSSLETPVPPSPEWSCQKW